ncbi:hypothetical protein ACWEPC_57830 [Nonomuraea sp. NPDC004297]
MKRTLAITLLAAGALTLTPGAALADTAARAKLPDLSPVRGKIVVRHVDDKAERTRWSTKVRLSRGYEIGFACLDGSRMTVTTSTGFRIPANCDGTAYYYGAKGLSTHKRAYTFHVKVQPGTRWKLVISTPNK